MSNRYRNIIYTVVLLAAVFGVWKYRQGKKNPPVHFSGKTMGPIKYNVTYFDDEGRDFKKQVDSILVDFNNALSTYIPSSDISTFNTEASFTFKSPYFLPALQESTEISEMTKGAYDPTVMPVINAWGFGPEEGIHNDSSRIDSLMSFVGFHKISFNSDSVWKKDARVQLDFSALAKGYGVDVVAKFLEDQGIHNMLIEIGGEVVTRGENLQTDKPWTVGILDPNSDEINQYYYAVVGLEDVGMATSGNYFNYHIIDNVKYGHTINPKTGFPIEHSLLSVSVFTKDCGRADALATACMVLGYDQAKSLVESNDGVDAFFIYSKKDGTLDAYATKGIKERIKILDKE